MAPAAQPLGAVLASGGQSFSFELFPPKTDDGERALWETVRDLEADTARRMACRYLIGCDGGRSTIRRALGIALEGDAVNFPFAGDVRAEPV